MYANFSDTGAEQRLNHIRPEQMATAPDINWIIDELCEAAVLNGIMGMSEFDEVERRERWKHIYRTGWLQRALIANSITSRHVNMANEHRPKDQLPADSKRKYVATRDSETAHQPERAIKRTKLTSQPNTSIYAHTTINRQSTPPPPGYVPAVHANPPCVPASKTSTSTNSISSSNSSSTTIPATFDSNIISFLQPELHDLSPRQIAHGQKRVFEAMAGTGPFATVTDELVAVRLGDAIGEMDREASA